MQYCILILPILQAITSFPNLTFIEPCIAIYFYSKTNQMHQCIKFISFGVTIYMFWTVFPTASKQTAVSV